MTHSDNMNREEGRSWKPHVQILKKQKGGLSKEN